MTFDLVAALTGAIGPIVGKHVGMGVADSLTFGGASGAKNILAEIKTSADQSNDNLFYWQIKTFLDTASDLSEEEVTSFLSKHPQGYRLGAEIFKILESTYIEKQAELIAIAFRQRVKGNISEDNFHKYIHVITQLNHHLIQLIEQDLINVRDHSMHKLPQPDVEISRLGFMHYGLTNERRNSYTYHGLEILGFIAENTDIKTKADSPFPKGKKFNRTPLYLSFYLDIYKDQIPNA